MNNNNYIWIIKNKSKISSTITYQVSNKFLGQCRPQLPCGVLIKQWEHLLPIIIRISLDPRKKTKDGKIKSKRNWKKESPAACEKVATQQTKLSQTKLNRVWSVLSLSVSPYLIHMCSRVIKLDSFLFSVVNTKRALGWVLFLYLKM
jgi:hypothetical protein